MFLLMTRNLKIIFFSIIVVVSLAFTAGIVFFIFPPKAEFKISGDHQKEAPVKSEIQVNFSRPINTQRLKIDITPDVSFETSWIKKYGLVFGLIIKPKDIWLPETEYKINLSDLKSLGFKNKKSFDFLFKTESRPRIKKITPQNNASNVKINSKIEVFLDRPNYNLSKFRFSLTPAIDFKTELSPDKTKYTLFPKKSLQQGTVYTLKIFDDLLPKGKKEKPVLENSFTTREKVLVTSFSPQGDMVLTETLIRIDFNHSMDTTSFGNYFSITPETKGKISWENENKTLVFTPEKLTYATNYTVTIKAGTKDTEEGYLENDFTSFFNTIGYVRASFSLGYGASGVGIASPITVYFNQEIDQASAQSHFSISPQTTGSFEWQGNSMIFYHSNFSYLTNYTIAVTTGVKSIHGLDSTENFVLSFTTESMVVSLNVPSYFQAYSLSCEVAAFKMVLAYYGIFVSEDTLLGQVGYNPHVRDQVNNIWDDPNAMFVGFVNGAQNTTGYGVYWGPIASVANSYRLATAFSGWSASNLAGALANGHPVIVWGSYGAGSSDSWNLSGGGTVFAVKGEHTRVVTGFIGTVDNPTSFYLNDPLAGRIVWSRATLEANWSWFGNSGVVIY